MARIEPAEGVMLGWRGFEDEGGIVAHRGLVLAADLALYNEESLRAAEGPEVELPQGAAGLALALYGRHGTRGVERLNGEFALALWHEGRGELVLCRDAAGCQPLYYVELAGEGLIFASEYKALLACDGVAAEPDIDMLQYLQHHKYLPGDRTLLAGVRAVPAAAVVRVDRRGRVRQVQRPAMPQPETAFLSIGEAAERVARTFERATAARVAGRSRFTIALSGGIDSIGVACAARKLAPEAEIHSITAGSGADDPEIRRAELVSERLGSIQHSLEVTPAMIAESLPAVVWQLENPIGRSEVVQFHALAEAATVKHGLVLTGLAGDALFAGMPRHKLLWLMQRLPFLRRPLGEFYTLTQSGRKPASLLGRWLDRLYFRGSVPEVPRIEGSTYRPAPGTFPAPGPEFLNTALWRGLPDSIAISQPRIERPFAAHGLRFTSPFFDPELLRLAFTIPSRHKIRFGREKYVLRRALRSIVPPEVLNAPKLTMRMCHDQDFAEVLDGLADHYLAAERVERRGLMRPEDVRRLRRYDGRGYASEAAMRLWTAVVTEIWAEQFLDRRGAVTAAAAAA